MYLLKIPQTADPAMHLAVEEFTLRQLDKNADFLFIYENACCVMLGKNQNPYEEVNPRFLQENNIPLYRRLSGGGTVFHGPGNINFSIITRRENSRVNNYAYFLEPVTAYLRSLGADARMNERNDLVIGAYKVSGNAQFTSRERMFSHGTLLFDADLSGLSAALKPAAALIESKCTASRRSPVQNIRPALKTEISKTDFIKELTAHILNHFGDQGIYAMPPAAWPEVQKLAVEKYGQDAWNWGRTPRFTVHTSWMGRPCALRIKDGRIQEIKAETENPVFEQLRGVLYKYEHLRSNIDKLFANYPDMNYNPQEIIASIYPFM